jgi:hypothetical protein
LQKRAFYSFWIRYLKIFKAIELLKPNIAIFRYKVESERKMKKLSFLMYKFVVPMKRSKKTKTEGLFYSTKM